METKRRVLEKVIKRDGREVDYDNHKIAKAIGMAYTSVYGNLDKFGEDIGDLLRDIEVNIDCMGFDKMEVEAIQDVVSSWLYAYDKKVGNAYYDYRKQRTNIREMNQKLFKDVLGIVNGSNKDILTENANKKGYMNSTQRDLIAGEISKSLASKIISKDIMEAHDKGAIKVHDLDYFINPIYNCCLIDLEDMLQNGTVINDKLIEKPKSIRTAMNIATQISAQVASSQYGRI